MMKKRIETLDGLRGFAAMLVVFHHVFKFYSTEIQEACSDWVFSLAVFLSELNFLAVLFFFILSGFSIALSLSTKRAFDWKKYGARRAKRILPVYFLALVLAGFIGWFVPGVEVLLVDLIGNIFFLQSPESGRHWFAPFAGNGPLWSLSFEVWFYLITPFLLRWLMGMRANNAYLILFGSLFASVVCIGLNSVVFVPFLLFQSYYFVWLTGFLLHRAVTEDSSRNFKLYLFSLIATLCSLFMMSHWLESDTLNALLQGNVLAIVFSLLLYFGISRNVKWFFQLPRFLRSWKYIGEGSYALYALHMPLLILASHFQVPFMMMLFGWMVLLVACYFLETAIIGYFRERSKS